MASAAAPYAANDVLGQLDQNGAPNFNQSSINGIGLSSPAATALDSIHHRLFVGGHNRVLVFALDSSNHLTSHTASYVLGQPNLSADTCSSNPPASSSNLCKLGEGGLVYDAADNYLFVSESQNNRVLVYNLSSGITDGMNASYVLGQSTFTATGNSASQSGMYGPDGLAYDAANKRLFVADNLNSRVLVFDLSSGITNDMNASNVLGQSDFNSINGFVTQHNVPRPGGMAYDSAQSRLFVSDMSANRISVFDLSAGITNGMNASNVLGQPDFTSSDCAVGQNTMCTSDGSNIAYDTVSKTLFFGDSSNNRVLIFDLSSGITNGMNASDALGQIDPSGNPVFTTNADNNQNPYATNANYPEGSALDADHHRLFVADCSFNRVAEYDLNADNSIASHAMTHVIGQASSTTSTHSTTQTGMYCPSGMAYDATNNRLYVADFYNNRVLVYDVSAGITDGMGASFVLGQPDFTSSGSATAQNTLWGPDGLAYDPAAHQLYVADSDNARVLVYDTSNLANNMNASYVIGQSNFTSSVGNISQDGMEFPYGLALDPARHQLFVSDWGSAGRVLIYDTSSLANGMNAANVLGEADFTSSNSASDTGGVDNKSFGPSGLAYDPNNQRLFVSDDAANRIMVFTLASGITNDMPASGVLGQPDLTTKTASTSPSATNFSGPDTVNSAFDVIHNRLYTADSLTARLLVFTFANLEPADSLPAATVGTAYNSGALGSQAQGTASYAVTSGALPAGLSLNTTTGVISGTPQQSGASTFSITLSDDNGSAGIFTDTVSYTLTTNGGNGSSTNSSSGGTTTSSPSTTSTATQPESTTDAGAETPPSSTTAATDQPQVPFLNSYPDLFSAQGQTFANLHTGDTLQLCLTSSASNNTSLTDGACSDKSRLHTITLTGIDAANQTVHFAIHSSVQYLAVHTGQTAKVDVNQDRVYDLSIRVDAIHASANTADITIKYLLAKQPTSTAHNATKDRKLAVWGGVAGVLALGAVLAVLGMRHRRRVLQ